MNLLPLKLYGINSDTPNSELALNTYTGGSNVKFDDGYIKKNKGYTEIYPTPSASPIHITNVESGVNAYWIYAGLNSIYVHDGAAEYDITRAVPIITTVSRRWTSTYLNGIPILNNKADTPIWWDLNTANAMTDITGWVAGDKCDSLRSYKNYLIAINVTTGGTKYNNLLKWSDAAGVGALPSTWVPAITNQAGEHEFAETDDILIDGLTLKDTFIVYKQKSTHVLQHIGGQYIFKPRKLFGDFGALAEGCVVEFEKQHAVLTINDFIVHDGNTWRSAIDGIMKKWLFNSMNQDFLSTCFVVHKEKDNEIWICYPSGNSEIPNKALPWNYREDQWFPVRDLPSCYSIATGAYAGNTSDTWDADTEIWNTDTTTWDEKTYSAVPDSLVAAGYSNTKLYVFDDSYNSDGVDYVSYVERLSMPLIDESSVKLVSEVWPDIYAVNGTVFNLKVGFQMRPKDAITWISKTFIVGTDEKIDVFGKGRFISYRVESSTGVGWKLGRSVQFGIKPVGKF